MDFKQSSFSGGMNLLVDDTRLPVISKYKIGNNPYDIGYNQYREAFNIRNRYDVLKPIKSGVVDPAAPNGVKQEHVTFGNYIILFVAGLAYYRYYTDSGWTNIEGFNMSTTAPRYWTAVVPVGTTNYVRLAATGTVNNQTTNPAAAIQLSNVSGANAGNNPGLLVQDNINQPQFIFLDDSGKVVCRTTQSYTQWQITYTDASNTVVANDSNGNYKDYREYVPIGNCMAWNDGILYVTSQDYTSIYRSVSGRPLDFMVNVTNKLATSTTSVKINYYSSLTGTIISTTYPAYTQTGGGDVTTTSYSVGVGGISCIRPIPSGGIFIAASNANFSVKLNTSPTAPTLFGEYTFIRTFLFNATCLSDRAIIDSLGDTRFIDLTGIRSFNAIEQQQNEGRNSQFSATIQSAFTNITQDYQLAAAILYDNYELYAVNTVFGAVVVVYDTILSCWTSFDTLQTGGKRVKAFAKIELTIQRLYAITEDDKLWTLYISPTNSEAVVRLGAVAGDPDTSGSVHDIRVVLNNITSDCTVIADPFTDNRETDSSNQTKLIKYVPPIYPYTGIANMPDINTQVTNVLFSFLNGQVGWKSFALISWTGQADLVYVSMTVNEEKTMNPLMSQSNVT